MAAVVKANAYGMGVDRVVPALQAAGCREFFVATLDEALALSLSDQERVYVFEGPTAANVSEYVQSGVVPILNDPRQLEMWLKAGDGPNCIHVDTGMHRLGFAVEDFLNTDLVNVEVDLLMTHFACADQPTHPENARQKKQFNELASRLPGVRTSLANSAAVLNGKSWVGDIGRPGIALYGGNPFSGRPNPMSVVATLEAQVLQLRQVGAGTPVGYGGDYVTGQVATIATIGAGYADGVPRLFSGRASVAVDAHRRCPIVGRVSMDALQIDATGAGLEVGDWVEIFGPNIDVDDAAAFAQTFSYEMFTGVSTRPERVYV